MTGVRHSPEEWREWMFVGGLLAVFAAFHGAHSSFFRHMVERDHFPVLAVSNTLMGIALLMLGGIMVLLDKGGVLILNTATWTSRTFASRFLLLSALFAGLRVAEQAAVAYGSPSDALYVLRCGVPCAAVALEHWLCGLRLTRAQVMAMFAVLLAVALEVCARAYAQPRAHAWMWIDASPASPLSRCLTHIHTHAHGHTHAHTYIRVHTCTRTHPTHTHTHSHTPSPLSDPARVAAVRGPGQLHH